MSSSVKPKERDDIMNTVTEDELKAHQKNVGGKRVTFAEVQDNIVSRHWFTALEAAITAPEPIDEESKQALGLLTICVLVLRNGFTVMGESACADPAMFNEEIGRQIAQENAEKKIWPLMGYYLKEKLLEEVGTGGDFKDRVRAEATRLEGDIDRLEAFNNGSVHFNNLSVAEQNDLMEQAVSMKEYLGTLRRRIARWG